MRDQTMTPIEAHKRCPLTTRKPLTSPRCLMTASGACPALERALRAATTEISAGPCGL
jgi:hypothetical protein